MKKADMMNRLCQAALLVAVLLTAGCNDCKETKETVLKPIAEHITGKWQMTGNSVFKDGKWEEQANEDKVAMAIAFRPDGIELRVMTFPDGFTALATRTWSVDEAEGVLTDSGAQRIHRLTENELVTEASQSQNPGTGEVAQKLNRWTFRRATEQDRTMAERLVGKWKPLASYEKVDGEWVDREQVFPEEAWVEFKEDGHMHSHTGEVTWSVNATAGLLRMEEDGEEETLRIEMPDEDTLVYYRGESKEVFVREAD